jgi:hypothetical protein
LSESIKSWKNFSGEIMLAGGASMCLVHDAREETLDIDALYEPRSIIQDIINQMALDDPELELGWLNDTVGLFPDSDPPREEFFSFPNLKIYTVPGSYLLARKMIAARKDSKDIEDIKLLLKKTNITTTEEVQGLLLKYFNETKITPLVKATIANIMEELAEGNINNDS